MAIPTATIILIWRMLFLPNGYLNGFLTKIGELTGWWGATYHDYINSGSAFFLLVGTYVWKNLGYTIILWLAGICAIPKEFIEASKVDGATKWKTFYYVKLPCLTGSFYIILILSFLNSFKIYREAFLIAGAYPHSSIYLLQHIVNN